MGWIAGYLVVGLLVGLALLFAERPDKPATGRVVASAMFLWPLVCMFGVALVVCALVRAVRR